MKMRLTNKELKIYKIGDIKQLREKDNWTQKYIVGTDKEFKLCWIAYELVDKQIY